MSTAQTTTTVSILGTDYTLRGSSDNEERIVEVGRFVDGKMRQARSASDQPHDVGRIAILTSLNIAYELFATRASTQDDLSEVRRRAAELADSLDACIAEAEGR